jgi:prepilin-type N-terminal cleavage/methylation domain-containing protein
MRRGFTLIEVLIAIAIVGVMILATSTFLQRVPVSTRETHDQDMALRIARDQLEKLRVGGYAALPATGSYTHALLTELASSSATMTIAPVAGEDTAEVTTTVSWRGASGMRSLSLTTLMTEVGGLP